MIESYQTPEACDKLISSIYFAEDSVNYLLTLPAPNISARLLEAYADLAAACRDLAAAIDKLTPNT